jgi:hypothetical protein
VIELEGACPVSPTSIPSLDCDQCSAFISIFGELSDTPEALVICQRVGTTWHMIRTQELLGTDVKFRPRRKDEVKKEIIESNALKCADKFG